MGGRKIRYLDFKNLTKYNIKTLASGEFQYSSLRRKQLKNIIDNNIERNTLRISLTSKDRCDCDKLLIDNFFEQEIKNMSFYFEHYYYEDKKKYRITITYEKKKQSYFERLRENTDNKRNWIITVDRINDNGEVLQTCMKTSPGSSEGITLEEIFEKVNKSTYYKIVDFLKEHKYNNIIYTKSENLHI